MRTLAALWRRLPAKLRRRTARIGHPHFAVTVGAFIFDYRGQILLLDHLFRPDDGWGVPGGFINKGEQPEDALRRELREEIGIEVDQVQILFARTLPKTGQIEIYFRAKAIGHPEPRSFEIKSSGWFNPEDLPATLSKDQRRLIARAVRIGEKTSD
jgi:ADP-ribose pyrophosphatase YjhB (NUDIX family)